jgi:hypothetical protein
VQGNGAFNSAVTWAATGGTINSSGVFTPSAAGTATITATSTQDATKSGSAMIAVNSAVAGGTCNITAMGTIQADGSLGGDPLLGDVYQIQGTITANYVDDDEAGNSTVTFTAPDGHTVTVGMFLLNAHANGTNTYAVRVAAGYVSPGNWRSGTWTWSMNYSDRASNSCTATGSFIVQNSFAPSQGFLRQVGSTPNLETDGNGKLFFPTGTGSYPEYWNGTNEVYNTAEIPCSAIVNVSGTVVTYVSGTCTSTTGSGFSTQTLPAGVYNDIYICLTPSTCAAYWNTTVNSSTSMTLGSSGGTLNLVQAYVGFERDLGDGANHAKGYQATLAQAAQFLMQFGNNFSRFSDGNLDTYIALAANTTFNSSGYNSYNWTATSGSAKWGIPAIDLQFAADHAAGRHILWGGANYMSISPCHSFVCTGNELSNLQNFYGMISARWGAFYDVLELANEQNNTLQTWVDDVGTMLKIGVPGIAGGNPADPYGHFFSTTYFPNNPNYMTSVTPYGPFSSPYVPDPYLNFVEIPHLDNQSGQTNFGWMANNNTNGSRCPGSSGYGGSMLPRYNGEEATSVGIAPSGSSASAPNNEVNGPRIVDEQVVFNQCGGGYFGTLNDQLAFNSAVPGVYNSWYDYGLGRLNLQRFIQGLDTAAAPITVTLGGGCAAGACSYSALGSSNHIRLVLNSATGNSATGIPNTVSTGTVTLNVPQSGMTGNWVNPSTGAVISTISLSSGSETLTVPPFQYDIYLQID